MTVCYRRYTWGLAITFANPSSLAMVISRNWMTARAEQAGRNPGHHQGSSVDRATAGYSTG